MTSIGALRIRSMSRMARALALATALMLAFACLPDIAHAGGSEPDGCPQVKLEGRSPASFVAAAVIPGRFEPGAPPLLAWFVYADRPVTPPSVLSSRGTPRAPPTA